jgi:hypothetical protein
VQSEADRDPQRGVPCLLARNLYSGRADAPAPDDLTQGGRAPGCSMRTKSLARRPIRGTARSPRRSEGAAAATLAPMMVYLAAVRGTGRVFVDVMSATISRWTDSWAGRRCGPRPIYSRPSLTMISIPLPAIIPKRKAAKRATVICASNIVIAVVKHSSCDLGLTRSRDILHDHFPDVVSLAVQHCFGAINRHADHRLGRNERRGWRHQLHRFHLDMQQRWAWLREPGLN